ncbi:MAG: MFS transporter [Bacteroidales bacterium]|nr:MFS transporter [Bacteroidales bacterium]
MEKQFRFKIGLPVLMSYIVMGFVDIVGVSTGYVEKDFTISPTLARLIPSMAFLWFFLLSIPTGIMQDRYGKRNILNLGMIITGLGMVVPFVSYTFPVMLFAFVLLGIGNTIVQVSANPLLQDVVPEERFPSFMSLSQFIKAIVSLLGPIIATYMAIRFNNWKLVFAVYAITSFIAVLWLGATKIEENKAENRARATFGSCFKLLGNGYILMMVLGIFLVVGADVGMNSGIQDYLENHHGLTLNEASLGISIYFTALMISRFLGAVLLNWIKPNKFLLLTILVTFIGLFLLFTASSPLVGKAGIFLIGFGSGNLFPLIFSITVNKMPDRSNEISGLMIMAVSGGAAVPPVMGAISGSIGVLASFGAIAICMLYLLIISLINLKK